MRYKIHRLACFANEYENNFIEAMVGRSTKVAENDRVRKKRELDGLLARDKKLDMLFERFYEVYTMVKEDGVTNQRVTIHYNCTDTFEVPDRRKIPERDILLETRKGAALNYAPAQSAI